MSLFSELKRRNVIRVAAAYLFIGWLLVQVLDLAAESFEAPAWVMKIIITLLMVGFIPTLLFSWAYELTPEGLKKDSEVDQSASGTSQTANKLNIVTLVTVAGIVALIGWQQMNPPVTAPVSDQPSVAATIPSVEFELASTVDDASIAVLPFADMSPEGDQGYFSDGVSEEILNVLAKIEGLRVASRTSAFAYKNSQQRIPEIASELQVRYVLEGSVRRAGETIRVTAQLIDAKTDEHLLSETFDRTLTAENVFAIQGDIAQLIVMALSERIEIAGIATPITVAADTENLATLDLYYEANTLFLLRGNANLTRAMQLFERITTEDPDFARGWSGLSAVYAVGRGWGLAPRDFAGLGKSAANRAIGLNPNLSTPYAVLANIEVSKQKPNWSSALQNFDRALQLNPDDANLYNWRSLFWEKTGFTGRAFEDYETCLRLDPSYLNCAFNLHSLLVATGDEAAAATLNHSLLVRGSTIQAYNPTLVFLSARNRDDYHLLMALNLMVAESYPDQPWMVKELFQALTDPDFDHAERLKKFEFRRDSIIATTGVDRSNATDRNTILMAFRDYDRAILPPDGPAFSNWPFYEGFSKAQERHVIIEAGLPVFWREQGFPPQCRAVGEDDFECN